MSVRFFPGFLFASLLLTLSLYAISNAQRYTIDPSVKNGNSFPAIPTSTRLFIGIVQDTSQNRENGTIGYTRTGRKTKAPIICSPSPASVVKTSLESVLSQKGLLASDASSANYIVHIRILDFSLSETSKVLSQTMNALIKLEVRLVDPLDAAKVKEFVIESQNATSAMDTSKYSEATMRGALESALQEIFKSISRI